MSFNTDVRTFQQRCWDKFYSETLVDFFNNFEYSGNLVTIKFLYKDFQHTGALARDYYSAVINKDNYTRPLRITARITMNSTGDCIDTDAMGVILIPELTPRGFILGGHTYDIANQFREAYGWYITTDKKQGVILSLKTRFGGKYIIFNKDNELFIQHGKKHIGFGVFLKAITERDSNDIINTIGTENILITKTITDQLCGKGRELTVSECIREAVYLTSGSKRKREDFSRISDAKLKEMLDYNLSKVDICAEGFERYRKFITFQRRAEGSTLTEDITLSDGSVILAGTNLSRNDLIRLDADENITSICVEYQGGSYIISKYPLDDGAFNHNMALNIANIAFTVFSGLGVLDDRDSLENRVVENVAMHIVDCLETCLVERICKTVDSYQNANITNIMVLADKVTEKDVRDYVVQRYKSEAIVQLKDDVNIIAELAKSYKLSYKKGNPGARVGLAVRNIKVKQYMRVCPIDTPEGKEVGLNTYLTLAAGVDDNGFITAKYEDVETGEIVAMNALDEMGLPIAIWSEDMNEDYVRVHIDGEFTTVHKSVVKYRDISPTGLLSLSSGYVPFLANNKPKRILMAANMNKQACHTFGSRRPIVTTANDNLLDAGVFRANSLVKRWADSEDIELTDEEIENTTLYLEDVTTSEEGEGCLRNLVMSSNNSKLTGKMEFSIEYFMASTSGCYYHFNINNEQIEFKGNDIVYYHKDVAKDDLPVANEPDFGPVFDMPNERIEEFGYGMGVDMKILFKSYKGFGYEDAVVLNRDIVENKSLTSIYMIEVSSELQENSNLNTVESFGINGLTMTYEERKYLTSSGLPAIGSYIKGGQIVIAKVRTEKGSVGNDRIENASVRLDSKADGWVVDARIINGDASKGNPDRAVVSIATFNDITLGDKMVGRHGNKGVIARIVPKEDMPFCEDGTIPDIILNPLGVIARGNVGQLIEQLVGMAGFKMGRRFVIPDLSEDNYGTMLACKEILEEDYGFKEQTVYNGETGLPYDKPMFVGVMHMFKLVHTSSRLYRVMGAAGSAVHESSQQPRKGQRISELQVNAYIAHGATETLDSLFSIQSDDIVGGANLSESTKKSGTSLYNNIDLVGDNKSDELVRAFLRTLGVDVSTTEGGVKFKYLTDDDILDITGYGDENVISDSSKDAIYSLHNEEIFGAESKKISRSKHNRIKRRNSYGRIELGYPVIMPIIFRNKAFLSRFKFIRLSFDIATLKGKDEDNDFFFDGEATILKFSLKLATISEDTVSALITGKFTSLAYNPKMLCYFDTQDFNKREFTDELKSEALEILQRLGFDTLELEDKRYDGRFYSPHKIDVLADMFRCYNKDNLHKCGEVLGQVYNDYYVPIASDIECDDIDEERRFNFVSESLSVIDEVRSSDVSIQGADFFVTKVLIMPSSFRARYSTPRGERHNTIDASYIKVLTASNDLKGAMSRHVSFDFQVSRLYQSLDAFYKKPEDSKDKTSIADMLLSSKVNKRSTVIRGYVGGKRVAYSARAVITVNPELHLTECGIPYKQALVLWEENLIWMLKDTQLVEGKTALKDDSDVKILLKYLIDGNYYAIGNDLFDIKNDPIAIAKKVEDRVVECLLHIMPEEVVILNREPALHKFSELAFTPVLVDGLSIQLHPLVCTAYNADFDGDAMIGVVCKTETAKSEARDKMMTSSNIINPKDGKNLLALKQDIVLGVYMATMLKDNSTEEIPIIEREPVSFYSNIAVLQQDLDVGYISLYDYVAFTKFYKNTGKNRTYVSTAGRIIFNSLLPDGSGFSSRKVYGSDNVYELKYDKRIVGKELNDIITVCFEQYTNNEVTIDLLDRIKAFGFKYADLCGATISIMDFEDKSYLIEDDIEKVKGVVDEYDMYERLRLLPTADKKKSVIKLWQSEIKKMKKTVEDNIDKTGSVFAIIDSGARGDLSDYNAICGIVGQVRNVDNTIIERPILGNYMKGLRADEFFISTYTARRGQISTSLETANSGTAQRNLSHMLVNVKVVEEDCGAESYNFPLKYAELLSSTKEKIIGHKIVDCRIPMFVGKTIVDRVPDGEDEEGYLTIVDLEKTQLLEVTLDSGEVVLGRKLNPIHRSLLHGRVIADDSPTKDIIPMNLLTKTEYANSDSRYPECTINEQTLQWIEQNPIPTIGARLLIGCCSKGGVCSKCYGRDIENKKLIEVGKYIGLISSMALSEVVTQGTMNVHHAQASDSGTGDLSSRFKRAIQAFDVVKVNKKVTKGSSSAGTGPKVEYSISVEANRGTKVKIADKLEYSDLVREQGLAVDNGIVRITNRTTVDGKAIVQLISGDKTHEYAIKKDWLIVVDGEEVRKYQPLIAYYSYNNILDYDADFAREFFIMDFANIFYSSGHPIRAIHFELIGREQCNYKRAEFTVDGCTYKEAFPRNMSKEQVYETLCSRYEPAEVDITSYKEAIVGRSEIMDSQDIIANAFSDNMFTKVGKYCMNNKVDPCTSPLTNLYIGKKIRGNDSKVYTTSNQDSPKSVRKVTVGGEETIEEIDAREDPLESVDIFGVTEDSSSIDDICYDEPSTLGALDDINVGVIGDIDVGDLGMFKLGGDEEEPNNNLEDIQLDIELIKKNNDDDEEMAMPEDIVLPPIEEL